MPVTLGCFNTSATKLLALLQTMAGVRQRQVAKLTGQIVCILLSSSSYSQASTVAIMAAAEVIRTQMAIHAGSALMV